MTLYEGNIVHFLKDHDIPEYQIEQRAGEGWTLEAQLHDYLEELSNSELMELAQCS